MNIVSASSVSLATEAFSSLGSLTLLPEGEINAARVREADAVVTRSKTRLVPSLVEGSNVRFAGTCTAGIDHADPSGLAKTGVHFAAAPGCNANAVSEYVVAALAEAQESMGFRFQEMTIGIIGHGNVGLRVEAKAKALGMKILLNDPPKAEQSGSDAYVSLEPLLSQCDIVSLHVPLVETGPYPTRALVNAQNIGLMKPGSILINACRGEVTANAALLEARQSGHLACLVLDVWDPEPLVSTELLEVADLGSAHIAGHSIEGKVNGTRMIRDAICAHFNIDSEWDPTPLLAQPEHPLITLPEAANFESRLRHVTRLSYDIRQDDRLLREANEDRATRFNQLRRGYRDRREWTAITLCGCTAEEAVMYQAMGFVIS